MKMANGYVGKKVGLAGPRRSTGQRYDEREYDGRFGDKPSEGSFEDGKINGNDNNGKLIGREEKEGVNGGNVSRRIFMEDEEEDEELAQGWPKWLLDNVSRKVLAGLVPKSAESYDKLAKVFFLCF